MWGIGFVIGVLCLTIGGMVYKKKISNAMGRSMRTLSHFVMALFIPAAHNPGHARMPAVSVGPYDLEASLTQDHGLVWGDPVTAMGSVSLDLTKAQVRKSQVLKEAKGDSAKALDTLLVERKGPDGAQALFQAMTELATGKPAGLSEGVVPGLPKTGQEKPTGAKSPPTTQGLFAAPSNTLGIVLVARTAKALAQTLGTPKQPPFDQVLFEHAIKLMAFRGGPLPAEVLVGPPTPAAKGSAPPPPVDPEVRATLRGFLGNRATQVFASKALGYLGDMETAKEIIERPEIYPDASISDFGPKALELYKTAQKQALAVGRGENGATFWQSMRIPPQHQDAAIELAMAGDGGAWMAMERNWAVMDMASDVDEAWSKGIDAALRFPGTRAGWVGKNRGVSGFFHAPGAGPKTYAMLLRALERDLQLIFSGQPWRYRNLIVLNEEYGMFNGMWHVNKYYPRFANARTVNSRDMNPIVTTGLNGALLEFYNQAEKIFRKQYRPKTVPGGGMWDTSNTVALELAIFAAHLKLPPLEFEGKKYLLSQEKIKVMNRLAERGSREYLEQQLEDNTTFSSRWDMWCGNLELCVTFGDIEDVEKL
jgi:hypothetical protein